MKNGGENAIERVAQYMKRHGMAEPGQKVLVGVSGGVDSVMLLHVLCCLRVQMGFVLEAAHFNHGIRTESAAEEKFAAALCAGLDVPLRIGQADVPALAKASGVSLEVAAREARHRFFRETMAQTGAQRLALAHHMDDQAETVLLRLFRGAGARGLGGMAPVEQSGIIRPLLCLGRADILAWCRGNGVSWREDSSNADTAIPRNWVRHTLLPMVREELNPSVAAALCRTAELLRQDEQVLAALAEGAIKNCAMRADGGAMVPVDDIAGLPTALQSRAVRLLAERAGMARDLEQAHVEDALGLLAAGKTGRHVELGGRFVALREADSLVLCLGLPQAGSIGETPLAVPGRTVVPGGSFLCELLERPPGDLKRHDKYEQYFDRSTFPETAVVRSRRPGDRFYPLGAPGKRKLKEYLIDAKIGRWDRDRIPLVANGSEVLWAVGCAISDTAAVTEDTRETLKITYEIGEENL